MVHTCHHHLLVAVLILAACASSCKAQPLEVVPLTDSSFEHSTQAATGQTTGHWCVLFTNSSADNEQQIAAEEVWEELAADEDKAVIFAAVDVASSPKLAARFGLQAFPAVILLRDRQMYVLPGRLQSDAHAIKQLLLEFLHGGYQEVDGKPVPGEPSPLSGVRDAAQHLRAQAQQWGSAVAVTAGVALFLGAALAGMVLKKRTPVHSAPSTPYGSRPGSQRTSSAGTKSPGKSTLGQVKAAVAAELSESVGADGQAGNAKTGEGQAGSAAADKKTD